MNSKSVDERSERREAAGENRLPAARALIVAVVVYALLPSSVLYTDRLIIPAVEVLLLIALPVANPRRLTRQTRWSRSPPSAWSRSSFSPTLVLGSAWYPSSPPSRAKMLMGTQATAALLTTLVVVAFAVGSLGK